MVYKKIDTHLSESLSAIDKQKAMCDDYAKCVLSDPQILASIVKEVVPEFKLYSIEEIIPCIGTTEVSLMVPEMLCLKIQSEATEDVTESDGKIVYDIRFPLYYNNNEEVYKILINIEVKNS